MIPEDLDKKIQLVKSQVIDAIFTLGKVNNVCVCKQDQD